MLETLAVAAGASRDHLSQSRCRSPHTESHFKEPGAKAMRGCALDAEFQNELE